MRIPAVVFALLMSGLVTAGPWAQKPAPPVPDQVIHAGRLIDGIAATPRERVSIVIAGNRVVGVEDGWQTPGGAKAIDLRTSTVLPGLIDSHTHITGEGTGNAIVRAATETPLDDAVRSTVVREANGRSRLHDDPQRRRRWWC